MREGRYLALLRGINVGGNNIIRMADLKRCFERLGVADVATFIQSGNVLFTVSGTDPERLTQAVEAALSREFRYTASAVVLSHPMLRDVVRRAPRGFGGDPARYRYDVVFLKPPLTAREALTQVGVKDGVDAVHAGPGVLYFSRLISRATQSRLSRLVQLPIYRSMTIRNWNTTTTLLELMSATSRS
jgi:uncharacterized protein (DUF1697 family)